MVIQKRTKKLKCGKCGSDKDQSEFGSVNRSYCLWCRGIMERMRRFNVTFEEAKIIAERHKFLKDNELKHCPICNRDKPRKEFVKYSKSMSVSCVECLPIYNKNVYDNSKSDWFNRRMIILRARAKTLKAKFDLTKDYIEELYSKQSGLCALSNLPMTQNDKHGFNGQDPYAASLDRIKPNLGYTIGNVRWVLFSINVALNTWGEIEFDKIASAYVLFRTK